MSSAITSLHTPSMASRYVFSSGSNDLQRLANQGKLLRDLSWDFLRRVNIMEGSRVLDLGCGSGEFTFLLAHAVGTKGSVIGADISPVAIKEAQSQAQKMGLRNVSFQVADIEKERIQGDFDAIAGRFILSYLSDPFNLIDKLFESIKSVTTIVFEEWQLDSIPSMYPPCPTLRQYHRLTIETLKLAGVDVEMGCKLPHLLASKTEFGVFLKEARQFIGNSGDSKLIGYLEDTGYGLVDFMVSLGLIDDVSEFERIKISTIEEISKQLTTICLNPIVSVAWKRDPL